MKKILVIISIMLGLGAASVFGKDITISGSTTVFPIAQKAAEMFMDINSDINVSVRGGGSGVGIASLIEGKVDIADASRAMKDKEIKQAKENGVNPTANIVAKDGLAIIVNPSNGINEISVEQLKKIYTGEISNWNKLGGKDLQIVAISRDISSGTYEVFKEKVLVSGKIREDIINLASNSAVASSVKDTPGAIGYVGLAFLSSSVKSLKVEGVVPSNKTVIDGTYELSRPLYMYTNGYPKGDVKAFLDFILSEDGQKMVEEVGYVPLK